MNESTRSRESKTSHCAAGRRALRAFGSLCLLALVAPGVRAQLSGSEFQVNSYTTDYQAHPAVATEAGGGYVVVWDSNTQDGSARGVFGQQFLADGSPSGSEFAVNSFTTYAQGIAAVAANGAGDFVVTWTSYQQDGNGAGVFGKRFVAGVPQAEFQVNTYTLGDQKGVSVAADPAGDTAVAWWSVGQDGSGPGVVTRRFGPSGSPLTGEQPVNTFTSGAQWFPAVAALGSGEFVVVWESVGQDGSGYGIRARRIDGSGVPTGTEIAVNSFTTGDQTRPAVAPSPDGGFVVVWTSVGQDGSGEGVFGRAFDPSGTPVGVDFPVAQTAIGAQRDPAIAEDPAGGFLVTWQSYDNGGYGVFGRALSAAGAPVTSEFRVNSTTVNDQSRPAVAPAGSEAYLVVWESNFQDGSSLGVYGQLTRRGLFLDGFESSDVCVWSTSLGGGDC